MSDKFRGEIPTSGGTGWLTLPFSANYQAFGGGFQAPQYKRVGPRVTLRGVVTRNTATAPAGSTCATLPAGFRPASGGGMFNQHLSGVSARVDVDTSGNVVHQGVSLAVGGYLSLDGISFEIA